MARIALDDPYETFLEAQVQEGFYSSVTDAVKDAIRKQMDAHEKACIAGIHMLIAKGEADI